MTSSTSVEAHEFNKRLHQLIKIHDYDKAFQVVELMKTKKVFTPFL